jgi:cytochrome b subunit of formate dehydrogenase
LADFIVSRKYRTLLPDLKDIIDGTVRKYLFQFKFKETGKYMASQKASFLLFVILGAVILVTGVIKLLFFYITISFSLFKTATKIHDISAYVFMGVLVVHILLVIARRTNWLLLLSWFNGKTPERQETQTKTTGFKSKDSGDNNIPGAGK